jgi:hypothetical protein
VSHESHQGQRCFGDPPRLEQALGLAYLGVACGQLALVMMLFSVLLPVRRHLRQIVTHVSVTSAGMLFAMATAVHLGLPGVMRRASQHWHPSLGGEVFTMLLLAVGGLALSACALLLWKQCCGSRQGMCKDPEAEGRVSPS